MSDGNQEKIYLQKYPSHEYNSGCLTMQPAGMILGDIFPENRINFNSTFINTDIVNWLIS